jgi:hypothetical protein
MAEARTFNQYMGSTHYRAIDGFKLAIWSKINSNYTRVSEISLGLAEPNAYELAPPLNTMYQVNILCVRETRQ